MAQELARVVLQEAVPRRTDAAAATTYFYMSGGDAGTSSGSNSVTTLNDTAKGWRPNEHAGKCAICIGGGINVKGIPLRIKSNTKTQIVLWDAKNPIDKRRGPWAAAPGSIEYLIVNLDDHGNYAKFDEVVATLSALVKSGTSPTLDVQVEYSGNYGVNWVAITGLTFTQRTTLGSETKKDAIEYPGLWRVKSVIGGTDTPTFTWQLDWELIKN